MRCHSGQGRAGIKQRLRPAHPIVRRCCGGSLQRGEGYHSASQIAIGDIILRTGEHPGRRVADDHLIAPAHRYALLHPGPGALEQRRLLLLRAARGARLGYDGRKFVPQRIFRGRGSGSEAGQSRRGTWQNPQRRACL